MLLSGKHERLKKTPYSVFVDLVGDLVRRLLTLPAQELATWSTTLNAALEPNGQVVTPSLTPTPSFLLLKISPRCKHSFFFSFFGRC